MQRNPVTLNLKLRSAAKNSLAAGVELNPGPSLAQTGSHSRDTPGKRHFLSLQSRFIPKLIQKRREENSISNISICDSIVILEGGTFQANSRNI